MQCWDLFNEPDGPEVNYIRTGSPHKYGRATELVGRIFDWAEEADPSQPLTAGVFAGSGRAERGNPNGRVMLASRSDVITFHSYLPGGLGASKGHRSRLRAAAGVHRVDGPAPPTPERIDSSPSAGSALLVGARGRRTQTRFPWSRWVRGTPADAPWFHELLHPDGAYYEERGRAVHASDATTHPAGRHLTPGDHANSERRRGSPWPPLTRWRRTRSGCRPDP